MIYLGFLGTSYNEVTCTRRVPACIVLLASHRRSQPEITGHRSPGQWVLISLNTPHSSRSRKTERVTSSTRTPGEIIEEHEPERTTNTNSYYGLDLPDVPVAQPRMHHATARGPRRRTAARDIAAWQGPLAGITVLALCHKAGWRSPRLPLRIAGAQGGHCSGAGSPCARAVG